MCFSKNASLSMLLVGLYLTYYFYKLNLPIYSFVVFYYSLMQLIHYVGYTVINKCNNKTNKTIAYLNYIHICFQPFVTLLGYYEIFKRLNTINKKQLIQFKGIILLSFINSLFLLSRLIKPNNSQYCVYCGKEACSFSGVEHIDFKIPLRNGGYTTPTLFTHFLFMFLPLLIFNNTTRLVGLGTFIFGMSPTFIWKGISSSESGSIWCFNSIFQVLATFLLLRT
jgi:hypothetical protein